MNRYHIKVYTKPEDLKKIEDLTIFLNQKDFGYTAHCLDNLKHRAIDLEGLLRFIKGVELTADQIFEYYILDNGDIEKVCFRIAYMNDLDLILVLNKDKEIITIYLNSAEDKHETLKKEIYNNES
jgi:hypothetical protein